MPYQVKKINYTEGLSANLDWVANVSRPNVSFSVCEACIKFKCAGRNTICIICQLNDNKCNLLKHGIKCPQLNVSHLRQNYLLILASKIYQMGEVKLVQYFS